jgi:hypothetical protein
MTRIPSGVDHAPPTSGPLFMRPSPPSSKTLIHIASIGNRTALLRGLASTTNGTALRVFAWGAVPPRCLGRRRRGRAG